jgi:hypothetical protein
MKPINYIVESGNWKCHVKLKDIHGILSTESDKITEVCTLAFEFIYKAIDNENVELISILDENGQDYVDDVDLNTGLSYVFVSMITKCYRKSHTNIDNKHYFILSSVLIKNSGAMELYAPLKDTMISAFKKDPKLKLFIVKNFKNTHIITNVK